MPSKTKQKEPFWLGGAAASMAVCFTHPLDQAKYRMQVMRSSTSLLTTLTTFASRDGIPSLWRGLSASILRQSTYSTARFGLYTVLSRSAQRHASPGDPTRPLSTAWTIACAGAAGGLAGLIGNPTEVVLVRMCADGARPVEERFGYRNGVVGIWRVAREEGLGAFGKGLSANVTRSVLMNVGQIAPYAAAKRFLLDKVHLNDGVGTHILSSFAAGTVATTICAPADVLKSRIQSAAGSASLGQIVRAGLRDEGPRFLMKGWTPAWLRLTPHTVLTFVLMEQLRKLIRLGESTEVDIVPKAAAGAPAKV